MGGRRKANRQREQFGRSERVGLEAVRRSDGRATGTALIISLDRIRPRLIVRRASVDLSSPIRHSTLPLLRRIDRCTSEIGSCNISKVESSHSRSHRPLHHEELDKQPEIRYVVGPYSKTELL